MFTSQTASHRAGQALVRVPIDRILPNPARPRRQMSRESIAQLADSIRRHGLLSPLLVRAVGGGRYELIAGERRLRALALLGRADAEALVLTASDCDSALIALVENLQREPLHFLDEAAACRRVLQAHPITQEKLAASLSCSPSALANRLRLLKLPPAVQAEVRKGGLSERHARALLRAPGEAEQLALAKLASERRLSVKQLEAHVEQLLRVRPAAPTVTPVVRDNRIVINALLNTVRELTRIGVPVTSRVEAGTDHVDVIVTIPAPKALERA